MAVKGKHKKRVSKSVKSSSRRKYSGRARRTRRSRRCMRGGNYETDVTTRTYENMPMKPLNKVVTKVPGFGTMSAAEYKQLQEDLDRNGKHFYD